MSGRSSEQIAFQIARDLPPADRRLVHEWVERTGCDWTTALLNSGAMTSRERRTPAEAARDEARAEADAALDYWQNQMAPINAPLQRRRRSAEHEASHSIVAAAFGAGTTVAFLGGESGAAMCVFDSKLTGMARAATALAPAAWFESFSLSPHRATGMGQDRRDAAETGCDLQEAMRVAHRILRENRDAVITLADKLDMDGHWFGPPAA
jgi:hypothetical protein